MFVEVDFVNLKIYGIIESLVPVKEVIGAYTKNIKTNSEKMKSFLKFALMFFRIVSLGYLE